MKVLILTGEVRTGKTTLLMKLFKNRSGVDGFLTPDVDGLRKYLDLADGRLYDFQTEGLQAADDISVGRFVFRKEIFEKGNSKLSQMPVTEVKIMIVDEIGKLETTGKGFASGLENFIGKNCDKNLILLAVIRDYLVGDAVRTYGLGHAAIVRIDEPEAESMIREFCGFKPEN